MLVQQILHAVDGETFAHGAGKQHIPFAPLWLTQPGFHHGACGSRKRCAAFLASFPEDTDVSTGAKDDILASEPGHLGYA